MQLYCVYACIVYLFLVTLKEQKIKISNTITIDKIYFDNGNFVIEVVDNNLDLRKRLTTGEYVTGFRLSGGIPR